ncbi:MAG: tRNA (adenosine(37)-N6)-dimethylallyltransferase MiaA [Candidatus Ratteibacteria bacterium]|nr:tRNA (adenosine(37)-N6)-dimethylallyltransferase MiaA [Candidatus Ratteibacteria bacterium]
MIKIVALVGPTAVGKTGLSHKLVEEFGFEIVSCDCMQVYSGMDIGTAKPSLEERGKYNYHMLDVVTPDYHYSAGEYARDAGKAIEGIIKRGAIPLVSGGSGLYLDALIYGISSMPKADLDFRKKMTKEAEKKGSVFLHELLKEIDPVSAKKIHSNDLKRIIRALEVYQLSGEPLSEIQKTGKNIKKYEHLIIGLNRRREELYERIEARVDKMFEEGLVEEVKVLLDEGYTSELSSFQALGYKEVAQYLRGKLKLEEAKEKVKKNTRNFAKRQMTYFGKNKGIKWFDCASDDDIIAVFKEVEKFLGDLNK